MFDKEMTPFRFVLCEACGSEGRIYSGHPNDPHSKDEGPCPVCNGTGMMEIEVEPVTLDDLALPSNGGTRWLIS